jgi:hypothetical protein
MNHLKIVYAKKTAKSYQSCFLFYCWHGLGGLTYTKMIPKVKVLYKI